LHPKEAQTLHVAINSSSQGQRLVSNVNTFIPLTEPATMRYCVETHQNLISSFQVIGNFLIPKTLK